MVYTPRTPGRYVPASCYYTLATFSYPEPFLRAVRRGALAKSISELASDWLVLTQDIVFLPCFYGIRLWIWPEPLVAPRVRRALGTRMTLASYVMRGPTSQTRCPLL